MICVTLFFFSSVCLTRSRGVPDSSLAQLYPGGVVWHIAILDGTDQKDVAKELQTYRESTHVTKYNMQTCKELTECYTTFSERGSGTKRHPGLAHLISG